jgi:hypothetical protein
MKATATNQHHGIDERHEDCALFVSVGEFAAGGFSCNVKGEHGERQTGYITQVVTCIGQQTDRIDSYTCYEFRYDKD